MKLRSGSTPKAIVATPGGSKSRTTAKRRASETGFEAQVHDDDNDNENRRGQGAGMPTRSQRRRIADPDQFVAVQVEVVVPTPSKRLTNALTPLAAKVINSPAAVAPQQPTPTKPANTLPHSPVSQTPEVTQALGSAIIKAPHAQTECTTIVARDAESALIQSFLTHHLGPAPGAAVPTPFLSTIASSSLYICGSPGVGKTALVTQLLAAYPSSHATVVHVNCFSLRPPEAVYAKIARQLCLALGITEDAWQHRGKKKETIGVKVIETLIRDHIGATTNLGEENAGPRTPVKQRGKKAAAANDKHPPCILVLDELDALYPTAGTSDPFPTVLYSLFSLAHTLSPHLALIGIANALDLTARLLPHLSGALAPNTLTFHSYSVPSLVKVLQSRFGPTTLRPAAAMFIARAIAKDSSDVRKALAVARDALARARRAGKSTVDVKEVHEAIQGMAARAAAATGASGAAVSGVVARVRAKPPHVKLALAALVSLVAPPRTATPQVLAANPFAGQVDAGCTVVVPDAASRAAAPQAPAGPPTCMQLYNAYCALVAQFPTVPLKPVHEAEFLDLVAVLEHDRVVRVMRPAAAGSGSAGRSTRRTGGAGAGLVADGTRTLRLAKVVLEADVLEVTRGLTTLGVLQEAEGEGEAGRGKMVVEYVRDVLGVDTDGS